MDWNIIKQSNVADEQDVDVAARDPLIQRNLKWKGTLRQSLSSLVLPIPPRWRPRKWPKTTASKTKLRQGKKSLQTPKFESLLIPLNNCEKRCPKMSWENTERLWCKERLFSITETTYRTGSSLTPREMPQTLNVM